MRLVKVLALVVVTGFSLPAIAGEAQTTRIETRPYYGAVITIENGVRVYRPVPPTRHLIVNPDGLTPLGIAVGTAGVVHSGGSSSGQAQGSRER